MKLTNSDIKTLNKIKKLCDEIECEQCKFYRDDHYTINCVLQRQPNWWNFNYLQGKLEGKNENEKM